MYSRSQETNVKGVYNVVHHFNKVAGGKGTFINLVTVGASFLAPGVSSYSSSKLAAIKLGEFLDLGRRRTSSFQFPNADKSSELPNLRVFSLHPGIVEAAGGRGAIVDHFTPFAKDKQALTAAFTLYLQKPEADFLRGGYVSVNWDVDEMEQHKAEITEGKLLKLGFLNAKLGPDGFTWKE